MYTIIRGFFAIMGVLFTLILIGLLYVVIADPFNLRPLVQMVWQAGTPTAVSPTATNEPVSPPPAGSAAAAQPTTADSVATPISPAQMQALEAAGIDPNTITPAQITCFTEKLGAARVTAIKAGATPSATELFSVRSCL